MGLIFIEWWKYSVKISIRFNMTEISMKDTQGFRIRCTHQVNLIGKKRMIDSIRNSILKRPFSISIECVFSSGSVKRFVYS